MAEFLQDPLLNMLSSNNLEVFMPNPLNATAFSLSENTTTTTDSSDTEALIDDMLGYMRIVAFICNFWTIVLSVIVIYKLLY